MKQALEHERARVSKSAHFPESIVYEWEYGYYKAQQDWDEVYKLLQSRLEVDETEDWPRY